MPAIPPPATTLHGIPFSFPRIRSPDSCLASTLLFRLPVSAHSSTASLRLITPAILGCPQIPLCSRPPNPHPPGLAATGWLPLSHRRCRHTGRASSPLLQASPA